MKIEELVIPVFMKSSNSTVVVSMTEKGPAVSVMMGTALSESVPVDLRKRDHPEGAYITEDKSIVYSGRKS